MSGVTLGRYELVAHIATGSTTDVFLARLADDASGELRVIKRIFPHIAESARFRSLLADDIQLVSAMAHPNICRVHALEHRDQELYLVTDYLEGATLLQLLQAASRNRHKLAHGLIAGVVQQVCDGLHYAHELRDAHGEPRGIIHGDVTPSNIFLTHAGTAMLVDFAVAKAHEAACAEPGEVKGKYTYMAPEQLRGQASRHAIDRRADVFSLAVVVCEMLICRRLVQSKSDYVTSSALMAQLLADLRQHRLAAPDGVVSVLRRALDRDPNARFPTIHEFGAALVDALGVPRPWTAADISELVRSEFSRDISFRTAEVSKIRKRAHRESISVLAMLRRSDTDSSADLVYDTGGRARPARSSEVRVLDPHAGVQPASHGHAWSVGARPSSRPLPDGDAGDADEAVESVLSRPRLRAAAVLGAAAAMLVAALVVLHYSSGRPSTSRAAAVMPTLPALTPAPQGAIAQHEPYGSAIQGHADQLDRCARDHAEALPASTTAALIVTSDGHARQIALSPDSADHSALGACIRGVLQQIEFPSADGETQLTLGLRVQGTAIQGT